MSEPVAKENFEKKIDIHVQNFGTFINKDEPFLSASPDGIIEHDMLLEIKYPLKSIDELLANKSYDTENDVIAINKSNRNGYFTHSNATSLYKKVFVQILYMVCKIW